MRPVFRLPRVHRTEHHGVRDFAAPDLQPTLEGAQKPIAIGPRIFELQSSKQLAASSPRLRGEPCVQLILPHSRMLPSRVIVASFKCSPTLASAEPALHVS